MAGADTCFDKKHDGGLNNTPSFTLGSDNKPQRSPELNPFLNDSFDLQALKQSSEMGATAVEAIEDINSLFDKVKTYKGDTKLDTEYTGYLRDVSQSLKRHFDSAELSESSKQVEMLKSKYFLLDVCFEQAVIAYQERTKRYDPFLGILELLRHQVCSTFIALAEVQQSAVTSEIDRIKSDCQQKLAASQTLILQKDS